MISVLLGTICAILILAFFVLFYPAYLINLMERDINEKQFFRDHAIEKEEG